MTLCDKCTTPLFPSGCLQCAADFESQPLILVDADIVTFQAAATTETTVCFDEGVECLVQEPDVAFFRCNSLIQDIQRALGSPHVLLCFSCSPSKDNFRREALETYKHNRITAGYCRAKRYRSTPHLTNRSMRSWTTLISVRSTGP